MRRDHVASTLIRRHFDVMCLLGIRTFMYRRTAAPTKTYYYNRYCEKVGTTKALQMSSPAHVNTQADPTLCWITKTRLYNFDPHKPYFYFVKLGFTGVYIIFLISAQKHRLWLLVRTASLRRF